MREHLPMFVRQRFCYLSSAHYVIFGLAKKFNRRDRTRAKNLANVPRSQLFPGDFSRLGKELPSVRQTSQKQLVDNYLGFSFSIAPSYDIPIAIDFIALIAEQ